MELSIKAQLQVRAVAPSRLSTARYRVPLLHPFVNPIPSFFSFLASSKKIRAFNPRNRVVYVYMYIQKRRGACIVLEDGR